MDFNAESFYKELDNYYSAHDSEGALSFMLTARENVRGDKAADRWLRERK